MPIPEAGLHRRTWENPVRWSNTKQSGGRRTQRLTNSVRPANLAAPSRRSAVGIHQDFSSFETSILCRTSFDILLKPLCCQPCSPLSPSCRASRARKGALAAASAMTKSRYPVRARRPGRPSPQSRHDAASRRPTSRAARRERETKAARVAAISMEHGFLPVSARPVALPPTRWSSPVRGWWGNTAPLKLARMAPRLELEPLGP